MESIFVSYRRSDSQGEAGRLFDDLAKSFGEDKVFMDVAAIEAGRDFRKAIEEGVTKCGVLLVLIGLDWVDAKDEHGVQRLADPSDFVRIETASALKRDIPVIPVLVRGARMPAAEQLPDELRELAYRNCIELTHARWKSDVQLLVSALNRLIGEKDAGASVPPRVRPEAGAPQLAPGSETGKFSGEELQRMTRELAVYIGPIASVIVKRAAAQNGSRDDLCAQIAEEIEGQIEREAFLRNAGAAGVSPQGNRAAREVVAPDRKSERSGDSAAETLRAAGERERSFFSRYGLVALAVIVVVAVAVGVVMRSASSREKAAESGDAATATSPEIPAEAAKNGDNVESGSIAAAKLPEKLAVKPMLPNRGAVRVSEETSKTMLLNKVMPVYPVLARQGHIQGMVVLDADVAKDGAVTSLRAVSGNPLLVQSAMEAVRQYRYRPYVQDGKALPMTTQISVNFLLSQQ